MVSLLWWDLVPTSPWGKLHPVSTAMLIITMTSIRTHSVLKTPEDTVSIGNGFPWLYNNYFQSSWFSRDGCQEGMRYMFLKKGGISRRGMKKERRKGVLTHHSALWKCDFVKLQTHFSQNLIFIGSSSYSYLFASY